MPLWHPWGNRNIQDDRRRPENYSNNHNFITNDSRNVLSMLSYRINHPRNIINYVSMAYDVWASKMAVKMSATKMENIEMAITSLFNSIFYALFVYLQVSSYKE